MDNTVRTTSYDVTSHGTQQGITVHEAAVTLSLSPEAVRARLRRGSLDGWKAEDDTWRVRLPETGRGSISQHEEFEPPKVDSLRNESTSHAPVTDVTPPLRDVTHHDTSHDAQHGTQRTQRDVTDDALVEHLREEVVYLRERLEDAMGQLAEERRRADVLRLGASVSAPDAPPIETYRARTENTPGSILAWLRRLLGG